MKKIELDLKLAAAIDDIGEEIKRLPRVKGGKIGKVPGNLQVRIVKIFDEAGLTAEDLAGRLGITGTTVRAWSKQMKMNHKAKQRRTQRAAFSQVKVREKEAITRGLTLEILGGGRVHNLSMPEIRELLASGAQ